MCAVAVEQKKPLYSGCQYFKICDNDVCKVRPSDIRGCADYISIEGRALSQVGKSRTFKRVIRGEQMPYHKRNNEYYRGLCSLLEKSDT